MEATTSPVTNHHNNDDDHHGGNQQMEGQRKKKGGHQSQDGDQLDRFPASLEKWVGETVWGSTWVTFSSSFQQ